VSCSRPIEFFSKSVDTKIPHMRYMLECGLGREEKEVIKEERRAAKEQVSFVFHGFTTTHIDAFSHFFWKGKMYNGRSSSLVTCENGALKNSVFPFGDGSIVSRGVLLDVARLKKKKWMDPGEVISLDDLLAAESEYKVKVGTGDLLLVRTGTWARREALGPWDPETVGCASLHPSLLTFASEREIALLGSDTSNDLYPSCYKSFRNPLHIIALVAMGLPLLDNANLEALGEQCEYHHRWNFLLHICPLPMRGTTGSPVNPIATF